jgi:hypothetical protein
MSQVGFCRRETCIGCWQGSGQWTRNHRKQPTLDSRLLKTVLPSCHRVGEVWARLLGAGIIDVAGFLHGKPQGMVR